jgi:hypothetical protein
MESSTSSLELMESWKGSIERVLQSKELGIHVYPVEARWLEQYLGMYMPYI